MIRRSCVHKKKEPIKKILLIILCILSATDILLIASFHAFKKQPEFAEKNISSSTLELEDMDGKIENTDHNFIEDISSLSRKEECYTFLVAASDQSSGNADTIMVLTFDTVQGAVGIVSVPRDTLINPIDGYSTYPKINSTYLKGVNNLSGAISNLLGIPIDYYVTVEVNGFVELIDSIGGIDFNIPVHMSYDDPKQNLHIHFEPGTKHLDGKDALKVCRLRDNNDGTLAYSDYDIGRTRTQQQMIIAVAKKMLSNPQKIKEYIDIFREHVETNLDLGHMLWFSEPFFSLDIEEDVKFATLPGDGTISYRKARYCYELFPEEVIKIVNGLINPYTRPLVREDMNIFTVSK